jgi:hypothetical protein
MLGGMLLPERRTQPRHRSAGAIVTPTVSDPHG